MELSKAFQQVTSEFIALMDTLDENELNRKPNEGGWSPGQVGDHIYRSYASAGTMAGRTGPTYREPDEKVPSIKAIFTDFTTQMESPVAVLPSEKHLDKHLLMTGLRNRTAQMIAIINTRDLSATCLDFAIPEYGPFTGMEWGWFNTYHTQRHLHQLKNIISSIKS
ncbi:DinB family protein [Sphingobacterium sp. SYP-B4668]|uniref:DinB family protein n=1 Tax=Sphingobacterium sp. SYP-B4668 TaxID=2996035 RepID=UPI0022DCE84D|nr:DinB family protein [Sphingobacterium sp. SYP-B4668]